MFQLAIIPNDTTSNLSLSFKTREAAIDAQNAIHAAMKDNITLLSQIDDYGFMLSMRPASISYILFIDVEKSQEVNFDKDMAVNIARARIGEKLESMGFKPMEAQKKSPIIMN